MARLVKEEALIRTAYRAILHRAPTNEEVDQEMETLQNARFFEFEDAYENFLNNLHAQR